MKLMKILVTAALLLSPLWANGPAKMASFDRSVVPLKITNRKSFNEVSRLEICFFVNELKTISQWKEEAQFQKFLSREKINMASIEKWTAITQKRMLTLYNASSIDQSLTSWDETPIDQSLTSWDELTGVVEKTVTSLPKKYDSWKTNAQGFYKTYLFEQVRLAALFPAITSEIHTLDKSESQGFEYKDGEFLLTFDDGPTPAGGNTDKIIKELNMLNLSGMFFVLGEKLDTRIKANGVTDLQKLYKGHRLESHGKTHKSHAKLSSWQESLDFTRTTINTVYPPADKSYFRPPYGQRKAEVIKHLGKRNEIVMLWNIDSQDWSSKLSADQMSDRVITLMLLWRSGIVLFHDVHTKVQTGLPKIVMFAESAELSWIDASKMK